VDKKTLAPMILEIDTYDKLLKIISNYSNIKTDTVSIREAVVNLIEEKYQSISGSMRW
jgi:hypothetical protein